MTSPARSLGALIRPAAGEPAGALVLLHGRGANERDLFPVLDLLDPDRRLLGVTPRAPLALPPGGAHWYAMHRLGFPDPPTFLDSFTLASEWLAGLEKDTGIPATRMVLGGFSQGAVMSYALGLGAGRPRPAAILAFSGFMPTVEGWALDLEAEPRPPVAIGHGTYDQVIGVEWGRRANTTLSEAGFDVFYREYPLPHAIDPGFVAELIPRLEAALPRPVAPQQ